MIWCRWAPHSILDAVLALGWRMVDAPRVSHHNFYSVLVEWPEPRETEPPWPDVG